MNILTRIFIIFLLAISVSHAKDKDLIASQILKSLIATTCGLDDMQADFYQSKCEHYTSLLNEAYEGRLLRDEARHKAVRDKLNALIDDEFELEQLAPHFATIKALGLVFAKDFRAFATIKDMLFAEHTEGVAYFEDMRHHLPFALLGIYALSLDNQASSKDLELLHSEVARHKGKISNDEYSFYELLIKYKESKY
ncbi:hypothetical protein CCZ01_06990 [Helicobacter monodelphidis]|uniref:hypothetical protein n=1 Tax=Helicobacter sp. 15-1451 TaxID=2004995 RepID=UPI000DCE9759|nr:hypothetical protein [Helicobacter sp. 15-1451]RAX57201.1 hypothetical protein CCZ01_06990 [Helicobacter sp. 15-1451]